MTFRAVPFEAPASLAKTGCVVRAALVAFPFLCPFVAGPSASVWQLLGTWMCVAALLAVGPVARPARVIWAWLAVVALAVVLSRHGESAVSWLPVVGALLGVAAAACVGAGVLGDRSPTASMLANGLLAAGLASAVLGLLQYYGLADPLVPWTTAPALGQAYGNLRQRNQFATLISMALVAALWLYATQVSPRRRGGLVAAALVLLVAAAASTSRTGLLELLSIIGVASALAWRERRGVERSAGHRFSLPSPVALLAMIPLYFVLCWLLPQWVGGGAVEGMLERLQKGAPDDHSRMVLWHNVFGLIAERPWAGWGWGELSFAHYDTLYPGPRFSEILDNAHNLPLHLAVELGVPAAVLVCGSLLWLVGRAKPWRERDPARAMAWGMLAMIALHSLLEYPLWYGPFQFVFGLCLGMLWPASPAVRGKKTSRLPALAATMLMAVVAYTGWDYIRISQIYLPRDERLPAYEDDTLSKAKGSWLFSRQVDFAALTLTAVTPSNAARMHDLALRTLHFSPEPRVIVKLIESAELLGRHDEARMQAERFRIAFPAEFAEWLEGKPMERPAP